MSPLLRISGFCLSWPLVEKQHTTGSVAERVVEIRAEAKPAKYDHLAARPDRREIVARGGSTGAAHRRPTVLRRIVAPAVAQIAAVVSAPDDHLAARPHGRVLVA